MSDTSNLCTRCGADNLDDGYFCLPCRIALARIEEAKSDFQKRIIDEEEYRPRAATVSRLVNRAPDDDGERVIPMTQDEIMEAAGRINARMQTW